MELTSIRLPSAVAIAIVIRADQTCGLMSEAFVVTATASGTGWEITCIWTQMIHKARGTHIMLPETMYITRRMDLLEPHMDPRFQLQV